MYRITLLLFFLLISFTLTSQRYLFEIFDEVMITSEIEYAQNYSILPNPSELTLIPLPADFYQPVGDTEPERPLVILIHGGNLLPLSLNGRTTGTKEDYAIVEISSRLAKMGYVVAAIEFRQGWNPFANSTVERGQFFTNAHYRGMQDLRAFIRFIRQEVASGNPWKINPEQIAVWGLGTGGDIALMSATVNEQSEMYIPKLINPDNLEPFIDTTLVGNIDGTSEAPYNFVNHGDYSDDFQFAFSAGGILLDTSWIDEASVPMAMAHVVKDPYLPFGINPIFDEIDCEIPILAPTWSAPVLYVAGPKCAIEKANTMGINDYTPGWFDNLTAVLEAQPYASPDLWAIHRPQSEEAPWEYWDTLYWNPVYNPDLPMNYENNNEYSLMTNPDMSLEKANRYIDTLTMIFKLRACHYLDLGCAVPNGIEDAQSGSLSLKINPNPGHERIHFKTFEQNIIKAFALFDLNGQLLNSFTNINSNTFELKRNQLPAGMYIVKVRMDQGTVVEKLIFQ